ncbi:MAG: hypothetical protein AAF291_10935 [Pseudomonadota bacterium]
MTEIDRERISLLCTKIGMLMEDHSARALMVGGQSEDQDKSVVDELADASTKIARLSAAAQSIAG